MTMSNTLAINNSQGLFAHSWDLEDVNVFYNQSFNGLDFPKLKLKNPPQHEYVVYSSATEFQVVQASTAIEAIEQCGIKQAYKVVHGGGRLANVIDLQKLEISIDDAQSDESSETQETTADNTSDESPAAEEQVAAASPAPEAKADAAEAPAEPAPTEQAPAAETAPQAESDSAKADTKAQTASETEATTAPEAATPEASAEETKADDAVAADAS